MSRFVPALLRRPGAAAGSDEDAAAIDRSNDLHELPMHLRFRFRGRWVAWHRWLALGCACLWLAACGSTRSSPTTEAAVELRLQLIASADVNPDDRARASPIMVRVYELRSGTAFRSADFFSLQDDERKAAGDDVLAVDEFILRPGETKTIERRANPATTQIGVLAGYRNLSKSVWRDVYRLRSPPRLPWYRGMFQRKQQETLTVRVDRQAVSIVERRGDKWVFRAGHED